MQILFMDRLIIGIIIVKMIKDQYPSLANAHVQHIYSFLHSSSRFFCPQTDPTVPQNSEKIANPTFLASLSTIILYLSFFFSASEDGDLYSKAFS